MAAKKEKIMKVLWLTNMLMPDFARHLGLPPAVGGGWMPSLIAALRKFAKGIELYVLSEGIFTSKITKLDGVNYVSVKKAKSQQFLGWPMGWRKDFWQDVANMVNEISPDIIHFHGSEGIFPLLPDNVWGNKPKVISIQGVVAGCAPHYMGNLHLRELFRYRNPIRELMSGHSVSNDAYYWIAQRGPREVEALSKARFLMGRTYWDRAWSHYLSPNARYFNVGEVLRDEFYDAQRDEAQVSPHAIYCGAAALYPLKGAHWLLRALCRIREKYPDVKLTIARSEGLKNVNNGFWGWLKHDEYQAYLKGLINKYNLWNNLELLPSLESIEVASVLKRSAVFCLPSLCENSPNSLGEAMLMGVPSVATDVGGVKSIMKDGVEGIVVPSGDPAVLADAIDKMFSDAKFARSCSDHSRQAARLRYDRKSVVEQLMGAYDTMMDVYAR